MLMAAEKDERVVLEIKRLKEILTENNVKPKKIKALDTVIQNTAWMKVKLDDAREKIGGSSVAIPYDNGGGQTGIRENPLFKGYESLWKSYMGGMERILACLPQEPAQIEEIQAEKPKTILEIVQNKHRKEAQ